MSFTCCISLSFSVRFRARKEGKICYFFSLSLFFYHSFFPSFSFILSLLLSLSHSFSFPAAKVVFLSFSFSRCVCIEAVVTHAIALLRCLDCSVSSAVVALSFFLSLSLSLSLLSFLFSPSSFPTFLGKRKSRLYIGPKIIRV